MKRFISRTFQRVFCAVFLWGAFSFTAEKAQAQDLSEKALFHRCYSQITSKRAKASDPLMLQVASGQKKAVDACLEVLNRAQFTANNNQTIANSSDVLAKDVLKTFHRLHSSWFASKDFSTFASPGGAADMKDLYDASTPALYVTNALFRPGGQYQEVVTRNDNLRAVRTDNDPASGAETGHVKTDFLFTSPISFAPRGELLGVQPTVDTPFNFVDENGTAGTVNLYKTVGGGILGTPAYLILNIQSLAAFGDYKTDGAVKMYRKWGKSVFSDLLCRELPVVREADVAGMVSPTSPIAFQTSTSCTKCHASHDRISGVVRGLNITAFGKGDPTPIGIKLRGGTFAVFHQVTKPAETSWSLTADVDYYQRPPNGTLYFRDYMGSLQDQAVTNVADLGAKIASKDDFYICAAKRYYAYFTGINVDTGDLGDPAHPALTTADLRHRDIVINLGKNLRQSQSLSQLISDILKLDNYRKIDFGIKGGANGQ